MSRYQLSRIVKLEQQFAPQHRHQSVITVKPDDDIDELLAMDRDECRRAGCTHGHMIVPEWKPPEQWTHEEWGDAVREQYEDRS